MDPELNLISFMAQKQRLLQLEPNLVPDLVFPQEKDVGDLAIKRPVSVCNHGDFHQVVGRLHFEREKEKNKNKMKLCGEPEAPWIPIS